jgi:hypothetical protein
VAQYSESAAIDAQLVGQGALRYSPERFEACLDRLRDASCRELAQSGVYSRPIEPCDDIFEPALEIGQSCAVPHTCASGLCPFDTRVCTRVAVAGEPCTESSTCFDDGRCFTTGICTDAFCDDDGMCQPKRALGEQCTDLGQCESLLLCDDAGVCAEQTDFYCDGI